MEDYSIHWNARKASASGPIAAGACVLKDNNGEYVIATAANVATYGGRKAAGLARTVADDQSPFFNFQFCGVIEKSLVPTVGTGAEGETVSINANGFLVRGSGSDNVGRADSQGNVYCLFGGVANLGGGSASLSGTVPGMLYLSAANTGSTLEGVTRESYGRVQVRQAKLTGGPSLVFAAGANTITRADGGSFSTDGFVTGGIIAIEGTASNNIVTTLTNVTGTVLTVSSALVNESPTSGATKITMESYETVGLTGASYATVGSHRLGRILNGSDQDGVFLSMVNGTGNIPLVSWGLNEAFFGSTYQQSDSSAGTTNRLTRLGFAATRLQMYADRFEVKDDRGAETTYFEVTSKDVQTSDATPTALGITAPAALGAMPYAVYVTANSGGPDAQFIWNSLTSSQTYRRRDGALSTTNFDGTSVTGVAATTIDWTASAIGPAGPWMRLREIDGTISVDLGGGNIATFPAATFTIPTSGGASPNGNSGDILTSNGASNFGTPIVPGSGIATWLATPSSANLAAAVTGETGSGALMFGTAPTCTGLVVSDFASFGGAAPSGGAIRMANASTINWRGPSGENVQALKFSTGATYVLFLGEATNVGAIEYTATGSGGSHGFFLGSTYIFGMTTSLIETAKPMVGFAAGSSTAGSVDGQATQAMADANQTPAASVYSRKIIRTTGALTANRNLTFPHPASGDASYTRHIQNDCTGATNIIVTTGTGTTATVQNGTDRIVNFTPEGAALAHG